MSSSLSKPPATEAPIIEPEPLKADSSDTETEGYGSGFDSETTSLTSTVFNYEYENGRRYHAYHRGQYALPNDEAEQDRLDMMHHVYNITLGGKLTLAPLENPQRILDIGTGTGIWVVDMGDQFPSAEIIGTDLSPIQPRWIPPNVRFLCDDAEADWMFANDSFDLVHARALGGSIQDWDRLVAQSYKAIKPGGYFASVEFSRFVPFCDDDTYTKDTAIARYYTLINEAANKIGKNLTLEKQMKETLSMGGFQIVQTESVTIPMGTWPANKKKKELGLWMAMVAETGFEAYGLALLTRVLKMDVEEVKQLIDDAKKEMKSRKLHIYCVVDYVVGQKPLKNE